MIQVPWQITIYMHQTFYSQWNEWITYSSMMISSTINISTMFIVEQVHWCWEACAALTYCFRHTRNLSFASSFRVYTSCKLLFRPLKKRPTLLIYVKSQFSSELSEKNILHTAIKWERLNWESWLRKAECTL